MPALLAATAAAHPDRTALVTAAGSLTFAEPPPASRPRCSRAAPAKVPSWPSLCLAT
ncbi:hypothetical protein ABZ341_14565 [Streptomyces sp. NPDC006173]|uniref:hypothetical protein n=1 Tax=Streptomyces sp. NPDC006173 TaxID=3155349 RepID=UPI0033C9D6A0